MICFKSEVYSSTCIKQLHHRFGTFPNTTLKSHRILIFGFYDKTWIIVVSLLQRLE